MINKSFGKAINERAKKPSSDTTELTKAQAKIEDVPTKEQVLEAVGAMYDTFKKTHEDVQFIVGMGNVETSNVAVMTSADAITIFGILDGTLDAVGETTKRHVMSAIIHQDMKNSLGEDKMKELESMIGRAASKIKGKPSSTDTRKDFFDLELSDDDTIN